MGAISTIGNILPILTGVTGAIQTVQHTVSALSQLGESAGNAEQASQKLAMKQLQQRQKLEENQLAQQTDQQRQQLALQSAQDDEARQQALRRAVARQRAQFGSQGVSPNGGSGEAVLLGLFDETVDDQAQRDQIDNIRSNALDLNVAQNRSLNLLQATQMAQRQKLASLF